jgi:hypothetical protein
VHRVWSVQGQLQGDVAAGGVADDVRALDSEVAHQRLTVGGLLREADRPRERAAARAADAMVAEHAVMLGEGWLIQQRREPIGKVSRMNQHHRLPGSPNLVLKFDALEGCPIHAPLCHDLPP